jgi:hypothetical protein
VSSHRALTPANAYRRLEGGERHGYSIPTTNGVCRARKLHKDGDVPGVNAGPSPPTKLGALVVIIIIKRLQQAVAATNSNAPKIESVDMLIPEDVIVIKPSVKPKSGDISTDSVDL